MEIRKFFDKDAFMQNCDYCLGIHIRALSEYSFAVKYQCVISRLHIALETFVDLVGLFFFLGDVGECKGWNSPYVFTLLLRSNYFISL